MTDEGMRLLFNAIALACCTSLAAVFGKWWLIFLAFLFWQDKPKPSGEDSNG